MPFPSVLNTFNRPSTTSRLDNPSHSALHNTVSSAVGQIEQVIGLSTTSVVGSLFYDIRSPDSSGGGHVQTAVKGGTGQTTFTKGDLLVATGPSTISKLATAVDGQVLVTDSSVAAGVKWGTVATKLFNTASVQTFKVNNSSVVQASFISVTIPGSTLGTSNVVRATAYINNYVGAAGGSPSSILVRGLYAGNTVASVMIKAAATSPSPSISGIVQFVLAANNSTTIQRGILSVNLFRQNSDPATSSVVGVTLYNMNTSSVESSADQPFGVTATSGGGDATSFNTDAVIIE